MVVFITGASHTGKTVLAQKILERYKYPYLSIDHLKMGLIRSGNTKLTPEDDGELTAYLWPIVREIAKTAIENQQNLVLEGCYIPFDWEKDFDVEYKKNIKYCCLIMTKTYIENHFTEIREHACDVERRIQDTDFSPEQLMEENVRNLEMCKKHGFDYILIDKDYNVLELLMELI